MPGFIAQQARRSAGGDQLKRPKAAFLGEFLELLNRPITWAFAFRAGEHGLGIIQHHDQRPRRVGHLPARPGGGQHEQGENQ